MANCQQVATFLTAASSRTIQSPLAGPDLDQLAQLGLVVVLSPGGLEELKQEVGQLQAAQDAISQESGQRYAAAEAVAGDARKTHSILFHLEGADKEHAALERLDQEQKALQTMDQDLAKRQQDFAQLLVKRSLLETVGPCDSNYVAVTTAGRVALRDLNVALYRVGDQEFSAYWAQAKDLHDQLDAIALNAARVEAPLQLALPNVDRSYLWAVSIGIVKEPGDPGQRSAAFQEAFQGTRELSSNVENRLMASEILTVVPGTVADSLAAVKPLVKEVHHLGVDDSASLGVASILLLGRRADGTFATDPLRQFLAVTRSFESAALLAVVNRPYDELLQKFSAVRAQFAQWGYSTSEDTELSAAYLSVSEVPLETVAPKVAILAHGIAGYLEYPLVAASILASIPVLEANETLNLLEKAYMILGQRTGPMTQAELICLAVRMVHGVNVRSVDELDATAAKGPAQPSFSYYGARPILWVPVFIVHGAYYSTFSGIGGAHPGHVHVVGGGGFGGGGG